MRLRGLFPLLALTFGSPVYAGLDLTPQSKEFIEEGVTVREVSFKDGEGSVKFSPPRDWSVRGQQNRLRLSVPQKDFAEAVIEATPLPAPQPLDEAAITAFKEQVRATLPSGSQAITILLEAANTMMPAGNSSFEVMVSYKLWDKTFQRSALLVNGPHDRLMFRFTSLKEDFTPLNGTFRRSVASWQWIEPPATAVKTDSTIVTALAPPQQSATR